MAGDWIKLETITPDKPEVHKMADLLGIDPDAVMGKLIRIWVWADQQTYHGDAVSVTKTLLDRCSCAPGFANAMEKVGWLLQDCDGFVFPNFERHNGKTAKQRALTSKRTRNYRAKKVSRKCDAPSVTSSSLYKEIVDLLIKEKTSPEFRHAWQEWVQYRANDVKKPLKESMAHKQLAKMAQWGEARSIAAIDHTIAMGWVGLREPDNRDHQAEVPQI